MTLQAKLDAFTDDLIRSGKIPTPLVTALKDGIAEQIASGQADHALKAGDDAPSFVLPNESGTSVSSAKLLAKGPLVVSFYRGVWCPYCNIELQALEEVRAEIEARGASLVAVSMQNAANSRKSARENKLGFPILIDAGGKVADAFGLRYALSPKTVELYRTLGNDLEAINGEASWSLPMPARFVIGQGGVIAYAEINPDYTRRPEPDHLFPILDQLARAKGG
ncbi:peroxiredoxin-like family protein [Paraburkholderia caffeinilytica]|uniref:peroxiredoxin-like family protein n=1 Tax=Paraburkholderia caffeinilytica TaxID=1761016 RepID=UPI0038B7AB76